MLNTVLRPWLLGGWATIVVAIVVGSVRMDAHLSTTALMLATAVSPAIIMLLMAAGADSPTVTQILHDVETKDGRL